MKSLVLKLALWNQLGRAKTSIALVPPPLTLPLSISPRGGYTKWGVYVRIFVQLATLLCWRQWFRHLLMAMRWCLYKSWAMVEKLNIMQNLCILQSTGYFALLATSKQWDMMATSRATTLKACLVHTYISHWYVQFLTRILLQLPRLLSGLTTEWWQWEKSFCTAISVIHCDPFASMWYGWLKSWILLVIVAWGWQKT